MRAVWKQVTIRAGLEFEINEKKPSLRTAFLRLQAVWPGFFSAQNVAYFKSNQAVENNKYLECVWYVQFELKERETAKNSKILRKKSFSGHSDS